MVEYEVVINSEEQYSIWPCYKLTLPKGWQKAGFTGGKADCLNFIASSWHDLRPLSLRRRNETRKPVQQESQSVELINTEPDDWKWLLSRQWDFTVQLEAVDRLQVLKESCRRGRLVLRVAARVELFLHISLIKERCDFSVLESDTNEGRIGIKGCAKINDIPVLISGSFNSESLTGMLQFLPDSLED